jgi:hypothetical protein
MMSNDEEEEDIKFSLEDLNDILEEALPNTEGLDSYIPLDTSEGKRTIDLTSGATDKFDISKIQVPDTFMESITGERVESAPVKKTTSNQPIKEQKQVNKTNTILTEQQIKVLQEAKQIIESLLEMTTVGSIGTGFSTPNTEKKKSTVKKRLEKYNPRGQKKNSKLKEILQRYNLN